MEFNELQVTNVSDERRWYMTVDQVAKGYGVARTTVMTHLKDHEDELRNGIEISSVGITDTIGRQQMRTIVYRDGVIKLGYFIRSERAKLFRQWATDMVGAYLDSRNQDFFTALNSMEGRLQKQMDNRFDSIQHACSIMRAEIDELRAIVELVISDSDAETIHRLIQQIKAAQEIDGRAIVGHIRKMLNVGSIYDPPSTKKVINLLKNMLGEGLQLLPSAMMLQQ